MKKKDIKVAIVLDRILAYGGAEREAQAILEEFPDADIFTSVSNKDVLEYAFPGKKIRHSFIHYLPFEKYFRQELYLLHPIAFRLFSFRKYDVVISVSNAFAKFSRPWFKKTKHIDICLTPSKFFWMHKSRTIRGMKRASFKFYSFFIGSILEKIWQYWDRKAARKADLVLSISNEVASRVKRFYGLDTEVLYPPVDVEAMKFNPDTSKRAKWFLYFGRVETYKGVDLAIKACVDADVPLKIAGKGKHMDEMVELVHELNAKGKVKFLGFVDEEEKADLYHDCRGFLFPVEEEDFGITPVEANAAGCPVIAYRSGGVKETVSEANPKTGVFFDEYTSESLSKAIKEYDPEDFDADNCRKQADTFAKEIFKYKLRTIVEDIHEG